MSTTKSKTLSAYQAYMQTTLRDKKTTFSDAVSGWKSLDDAGKAKWKEEGTKIAVKAKPEPKPKKEVNKNLFRQPRNRPSPQPAPAEEKQVSRPRRVGFPKVASK